MKPCHLIIVIYILYGSLCQAKPFKILGSATAVDLATGLEWERDPPATKASWVNSVNRCRNLNLDGHSDWRLPNVKELVSMHDIAQSPFLLNQVVFIGGSVAPSQLNFPFWTSTTAVADGTQAYALFSSSLSTVLRLKSFAELARCVRN